MDSAVDDPGAAGTRHAAYLVAAQGIAGVDANAHNVARLDGLRNNLFERFVHENGVADLKAGVAGARTNSQRGVMTAVPKELSLGLTR